MTVERENRHYTTIKIIFRLLSRLNGESNQSCHFCINYLNGFRTASAKDKQYEYCSSNSHVKVKISSEKEKWLKFHNGQYQFKFLFMLYAEFESMLKQVDEPCREKMNKIKTKRKGKTLYTEKIITHVPSGWCVSSTFAYGDVPDTL